MIRRQLINFGNKSTDFRMGFGAFAELPRMVAHAVITPKRAVLVTEADLADGRAIEVSRALIDAGFTVSDLALPSGERVSTLGYAMELYQALDASGITADDLIVAFGGSQTCAVVSYCARTWCGETPYVLIPSTLDAMTTVATSVRALDSATSPEMVTVEPRAAMVICDLDLVAESNEDSLKLGYVELMVSALIDSKRQWERFGDMMPKLLDGQEVAVLDSVGMAQSARLSVINSSNPSARNALQFGITTARALRHLLGEEVPWYRLLAEGIRFESRLAHDECGFDIDDVFEIDDRLEELGIDELAFSVSPEQFIAAIKETRFKRSNRLMFSLPRHVGTVRFTVVDDEVLKRHAEAYVASRAELCDGDLN